LIDLDETLVHSEDYKRSKSYDFVVEMQRSLSAGRP